MRLLKFELKKIWRPGIVGAILVIGLIFSYLFLDFPLSYFPNGPQCQLQYELMKTWTEKYGTTMDESERKDAEKELVALKEEADEYIKNHAIFAEVGFTCYEDVENFVEEEGTGKEQEAVDVLFSEKSDYLGERIQQLEGALFEYDIRYEEIDASRYTKKEQIRIEELYSDKKLDGLMPYEVMGNVMEYSRWAIIFVVLSIFILIAPAITRDRKEGLRQLQWSSNKGRGILKAQLAAIFVSVFILTGIEFIVFGLLYARLGTQYFWNNPINSFFYSPNIYWYDLTYGQYVLSILGIALGISCISTLLVFAFSRYSGNFVSLLMKVIPGFVIVAYLVECEIEYLFSFSNVLSSVTGVVGMEIWMVLGLLLLSVGVCAVILRRENKCEA